MKGRRVSEDRGAVENFVGLCKVENGGGSLVR